MSVSADRSNSVAKEMRRCSRKHWRRANVRWRLKAGYELLGYGISQWGVIKYNRTCMYDNDGQD